MGPPLCRTQKRHFWYPAPTLVQSDKRIPEMYFQFNAERRGFETQFTYLTLLSVMAVTMSYLTHILTKYESLIVPLSFVFQSHWSQSKSHSVALRK